MLDRVAFWAVHLGLSLGDGLDGEVLGVERGLARGTYLRLTDDQPSFTVAAGGGSRLEVAYREDEVDYLLLPPDGAAIVIGVAEGVPDGPALSWAELAGVAAHQEDTVARARALLLLAPLLGDSEGGGDSDGDAESESGGRGDLSWALRTVGVDDDEGVAARLVTAQPTRWRTAGGVRVCDHPGSTRNPDGPRALPADARAAASRLLSP